MKLTTPLMTALNSNAFANQTDYELMQQWLDLKSLLERGKREQVLRELEAFYEIELSVALIRLKAQLYFALEDYDKAYISSLSRRPQLIGAHSDLGQLYLLKVELEKAREHFSNAISYGAQDALIYGQLANLNFLLYGPYSAISA